MIDMTKWVARGLDATAIGIETLGKASESVGSPGRRQLRQTSRFVPSAPTAEIDAEADDGWGFADSRFTLNERGHVQMSGHRYAISGQELPALWPWIQGALGVTLDANEPLEPEQEWVVPEPQVHADFLRELSSELAPDQMVTDPVVRVRHGHGHTQAEIYTTRYTGLVRVPDLVVFPHDESQVRHIVDAARNHDVCLIAYGGGTNVTDALRCPETEARMIVSVDMRRMNRILWIDPTNMMASIQAGAVGRHIQEQLEVHGYTLGHEPDSIEFSTLGGWIATNASGMKKNLYGNIEDLVLDVQVVTAEGTLSRTATPPRESSGADVRRLVFGSEGNLGIITSAVVKIFPKPSAQRYGSVLFKSFEDGVAFMYDLTRRGAVPASVRLVDNLQFQFGMALKPGSTGMQAAKSKLERLFVTRLRGFDPDRMVACTLVFEGEVATVAAQEAEVYRVAARHGGLKAGASNGERGYQLTFGIAYIRDFAMQYHVFAESFETSVAWSELSELCRRVKERVFDEHGARRLPGRPFFTYRVTQVYQTGACVYFYLGLYLKGVPEPSQVFAEIEAAARDEVLRAGGSLSHHHGVGKLRARYLPRVMSRTALGWSERIKAAVDPGNVFGAANQRPAEHQATKH